jgi:hypothetical protein
LLQEAEAAATPGKLPLDADVLAFHTSEAPGVPAGALQSQLRALSCTWTKDADAGDLRRLLRPGDERRGETLTAPATNARLSDHPFAAAAD